MALLLEGTSAGRRAVGRRAAGRPGGTDTRALGAMARAVAGLRAACRHEAGSQSPGRPLERRTALSSIRDPVADVGEPQSRCR
jgi:hypothetical protein